MVLVKKPHKIPIEERLECLTHLHVFINGNEWHAERWMEEQTFDVIYYVGWTRSYYFEQTQHFVLMQMTLPDPAYLVRKPWNDDNPHMAFYNNWDENNPGQIRHREIIQRGMDQAEARERGLTSE